MIDYFYKIKIIGDKKFIVQTKRALKLIKTKSKVDFDKIVKYIRAIKYGKISRIILKKAQFIVGEKTAYSDLEWYASTIIHETHHQYLHSNKILIWKYGNFWKHERLCLDEQIRFLKQIKAKEKLIAHAESSFKTGWWLKSYRNKNVY